MSEKKGFLGGLFAHKETEAERKAREDAAKKKKLQDELNRKMEIQKTQRQLNAVMNNMMARNDALSKKTHQLEESIMENLGRGDKLRAQLECMEYKMISKQSKLCYLVAVKVQQKKLEFETMVDMNQFGEAIATVAELNLGDITNMEAIIAPDESNPLWPVLEEELKKFEAENDVSDLMAQFEERFAQTQMSAVASPLDINNTNDTSFKTNN